MKRLQRQNRTTVPVDCDAISFRQSPDFLMNTSPPFSGSKSTKLEIRITRRRTEILLFSYHEDGGDISLRNVGFSPNCTGLQSRRWYISRLGQYWLVIVRIIRQTKTHCATRCRVLIILKQVIYIVTTVFYLNRVTDANMQWRHLFVSLTCRSPALCFLPST